MEIQFSEFIPYLLVWMCGEFNYESNGPFGIENGVRTRKLRPKRRKQEIWPFGQKGQVSGRGWLATMPLWHCRMAMSRPSQGCMREWHATMPFWHSRGHSRPYPQIRVFNLISFLISHPNISPLLSLGSPTTLSDIGDTSANLQRFWWINHYPSYHSWRSDHLLLHQASSPLLVSFSYSRVLFKS